MTNPTSPVELIHAALQARDLDEIDRLLEAHPGGKLLIRNLVLPELRDLELLAWFWQQTMGDDYSRWLDTIRRVLLERLIDLGHQPGVDFSSVQHNGTSQLLVTAEVAGALQKLLAPAMWSSARLVLRQIG